MTRWLLSKLSSKRPRDLSAVWSAALAREPESTGDFSLMVSTNMLVDDFARMLEAHP